MKKVIEILIFALALAAFVSCDKEPDPEPFIDPDPFVLSEYVVGTWEWRPYGETDLEFWTLTFNSNHTYNAVWHIDTITRTSNSGTYGVNDRSFEMTINTASFYWQSPTWGQMRTDFNFPPSDVEVVNDSIMNLSETGNPDNVFIFTRIY